MLRRWRQRKFKKSNKIVKQNNNSAHVNINSVRRHCTTTTWNSFRWWMFYDLSFLSHLLGVIPMNWLHGNSPAIFVHFNWLGIFATKFKCVFILMVALFILLSLLSLLGLFVRLVIRNFVVIMNQKNSKYRFSLLSHSEYENRLRGYLFFFRKRG